MKVAWKQNEETKLWDVVDGDTGVPLMHGTNGNRQDAGGHADEAKAERQAGYLQKYYDKKAKEDSA